MKNKEQRELNFVKFILVCGLGILLNVGGAALVRAVGAPIWLDAVGTVLAAGLCGYLPGIAVGLFSNLINGLFDTDNFYYAVVNVLIAVITYQFVKRKLTEKIWGVILLPIVLALLASLHYMLLQGAMDIEGLKNAGPWSEFLECLKTEIIDKTITVAILILALNFLPDKVRKWLRIEGWQQKVMSSEERKNVEKSHNRRMSLKTKILILLIGVFAAVGSAAMLISTLLYRQYCIDEHILLADGTARLVAATIDPERVDEYIKLGGDAPGYKETEELLSDIRDTSQDVVYVYAYKIEPDGCHVVFDLDTEELEGEPPGAIVPFDESFSVNLPALLAGKSIDPIITDDTYGWLITCYQPVKNSSGETVCYAAADVSMNLVNQQQRSFLIKLLSLFLGVFIFALAIGLWISEYNIILPVNAMEKSASAFAYNDEDSLDENVARIRDLDIHTGDEIENMYLAFTKTTENSANYVSQLHTKTETIEQMQDALIMVLADMVESRDENTGDHVRKTAAYTRIIMDQMKEMGYYTDQLTDQFIYDVEHSAPLHDIGKIAVSDVILNKPGKLTDEEFEIMKTHTTAGAEILEQVINTVPDSGYLVEAKNLAEYHHEKWNGRGYPHALKGEDIPLSARIMAVADVFDALVSERCYKKAFPFEKAMDIIREDAGSHFDPKVAEAFIAASDQVRQVAEHFSTYKPKR